MIWDLHCHISNVEGTTPDEKIAAMMTYADRMGVERMVFYMGTNFSTDPDPEEFRRQNDEVLQALSHWHHRAFGFAYLNPKYPEACLQEIDRCIVNGPMVGIKLWVALRCNDPRLDEIIHRCAELKAVIFQHTWLKSNGNLEGESTPMDMAVLAARHPDTPLICGHTGGDWEQGIRAIRVHKNVSVDLAGSEPTAGFVEMAVRELGAERVIYGSDVGGRSFSTQLAKVYGAKISNVEKKLILGKNLRRMMEPILRIKGVKP
ncbi:MAG: amidohydrolase family protein [Planctomycetota bacterium]|nr:amidohydrolase family protein [Planctomycetota bacterium]MDA1211842.1 amidohydrolase family protein [Planctomycetota bacterium]